MSRTKSLLLLACLLVPFLTSQSADAKSAVEDQSAKPESAMPQIFAPGVVSGPANDGSPAFSPDGKTIFFTRTNGNWEAILESHKTGAKTGSGWSKPVLAPFSGEWADGSLGISPDGSYLVFTSRRPVAPAAAGGAAKMVANLWRVDRVGSGWSKPVRLPDTVNIGHSIWKPSVAANGTLYFVSIDAKGGKRLYSSRYESGVYQQAQPLPFSDGTTLDVDPEIAPDESFLVFCSAGRLAGDSLDHLFIVARQGSGWGPAVPIRYAGDDKPSYSTDDEPHLGPQLGPQLEPQSGGDGRRLYFSSDRAFPVDYPRSHETTENEFERMQEQGWFGGYANIWSIPLEPWLSAAKKAAGSKS
jgi:hypothetical protein